MGIPACPVCHKKTRCKDSRPMAQDTMVRRRYECVNGHAFSSVEFVVDDFVRGKDALEQVRESMRKEGRAQLREELRSLFSNL